MDDVVVATDRRTDVRVIVNVPGRYTLGSRRDINGDRRVFACKALNMSASAIALMAPVIGPLGDRVTANIEHFGRFSGTITRQLSRGFVISLAGNEEEQSRLADKLVWFDQYRNHDVADGRKHGRIAPKNPYSTLLFSDGSTLTCLVIDMSISGVAVSADVVPPVGTVMAVGRVIGRVVRSFAEGFALQFAEIQNLETLEQRLIVS
jgi:hypothetical protein